MIRVAGPLGRAAAGFGRRLPCPPPPVEFLVGESDGVYLMPLAKRYSGKERSRSLRTLQRVFEDVPR
eukprot:9454429-Pyramimonas_sp.AAC.1